MRKNYIHILILILSFVVPSILFAGSAVVDGTPPTEYEDGSSLAPEEIKGYNLYSSATATGPYTLYVFINGFPATISIPNGKTIYFVATTMDVYDNESGYSNEAIRVPSKPNKPMNFKFNKP